MGNFEIKDIRLQRESSGKSKGYAYVEMASEVVGFFLLYVHAFVLPCLPWLFPSTTHSLWAGECHCVSALLFILWVGVGRTQEMVQAAIEENEKHVLLGRKIRIRESRVDVVPKKLKSKRGKKGSDGAHPGRRPGLGFEFGAGPVRPSLAGQRNVFAKSVSQKRPLLLPISQPCPQFFVHSLLVGTHYVLLPEF